MTLFSLAKLADSRDPETGEHLIRIRSYCDILARELHATGPYRDQIDIKFIDDLYRASPLHDIGKVGVRDAILMKPGRLTTEEFEEMKKHVLLGAETLEGARDQAADFGHFLSMAVEITRYHHERWNGTGYCEGLKGTTIPLSARIVALADVFDALTSKRCYKPAYTAEYAYDVIVGESEKHFDPVIVEAFQRRFPRFRRAGGFSDEQVQSRRFRCPVSSRDDAHKIPTHRDRHDRSRSRAWHCCVAHR